MKKTTLKFLLIPLLIGFSNLAIADWNSVEYFPSERIDSAGKSGHVFLDGWEGSVLNPASVYKQCSSSTKVCSPKWVLRFPYVEMSDTTIALAQKKGTSQQVDFLSNHLGDVMTARVNSDLGYVNETWALGVLYQESYHGKLFLDLNNFGLETLEVDARRTFGISGSYRYPINDKFSTGVSTKVLRRDVRNIEAAITDFGAVTNLKNLRKFDVGYGLLIDLGMQYQAHENSGPRVGIVIRQVGDAAIRTKFPNGRRLETIPQSVDFASGYRWTFVDDLKLDMSFDINDTLNRLETNFIKRTHAGFSIGWGLYNFYSGLNGGYTCLGIKVTYASLTLDLGTMGQETSSTVGARQDRRYFLATRASF